MESEMSNIPTLPPRPGAQMSEHKPLEHGEQD